VRDRDVLTELAAVMRGASTQAIRRAARKLIEAWRRPILFVWSRKDPVFPIEHARRYAAALADARVLEVDDCFSFTPEDQPAKLAAAIADFAAS
jgi:pimeloyl-ACP methyl ester carboxylesterase